MTGEDDDLRGFVWFGRNVPMSGRVSVNTERPGEKMGHRPLLSGRQVLIRQRPAACAVLGRREGGSHQLVPYQVVREISGLSNHDFNFTKGLKNRCVVLAAQKSRIDFRGDERVELIFWEQTCFSVSIKISPRSNLLPPSGDEEPRGGLMSITGQEARTLQPSPCFHERPVYFPLQVPILRIAVVRAGLQRAEEVYLAYLTVLQDSASAVKTVQVDEQDAGELLDIQGK